MTPAPGRAHSDPHGHEHGPGAGSDRRHLLIALALLAAFMAAEVITAILSGSLALLSDAGHMLSDVGAIGGALWAISLAARPASGKWTYGLKRAEILSAAGNGITLLVVSGIVTAEAISRLIHPPAVDGGPVIAVAVAGIAVNVAASWVLARADRSSLNIQGAFRHVLTDLYGFIGTVIAGIIIVTTGFTRADAIASLLVVALMVKAAWELLRDSGRILLEAAPEGMDMEQVRAHLAEVPTCSACTTCTPGPSPPASPPCPPTSSSKTTASTTGTPPGCSTSSRNAWPATSTSSTPPSSSRPPPTPATSPAPTSRQPGRFPPDSTEGSRDTGDTARQGGQRPAGKAQGLCPGARTTPHPWH
jgi:cobalt-zinc-cadmium efflux system protein